MQRQKGNGVFVAFAPLVPDVHHVDRDDIEALERCQQGFAARDAAPWNDISRGMVRANPLTTDELQMRTFWREWDRRMTGTVHPSEVPVSPRAGRVAGLEAILQNRRQRANRFFVDLSSRFC